MKKTAAFVREIIEVIDKGSSEGIHWIEIPISGWDEVKTHTKKILEFNGREYGWSCWNSDRMVSVFRSPALKREGKWKS